MVAKKLGEGTFGIVELAELADGRKVAIKRLKADWDEHQVAMFQAEKRVLSSLQHRSDKIQESYKLPSSCSACKGLSVSTQRQTLSINPCTVCLSLR